MINKLIKISVKNNAYLFILASVVQIASIFLSKLVLVFISRNMISSILLINISNLHKNLLYFSIIILILLLLGFINSFFMFSIKRKSHNFFEDKLLNTIFNYDDWQIKYSGNEIYPQIRNDIPNLINTYTGIIYGFINIIFSIIFAAISAISINWKVYIICLLIIIITIILLYRNLNKISKLEKQIGALKNKTHTHLSELIQNAEIVPFLNDDLMYKLYKDDTEKLISEVNNRGKIDAKINILKKITTVGLFIVICFLNIAIFKDQAESHEIIANILALSTLIAITTSSFLSIIDWLGSVKTLKGIVGRLDLLFNRKKYDDSGIELKNGVFEIKIEKLRFKYEDNEVLKNVNCVLEKDNVYYLKGISGQGKSTLLKIISKLINSYDGDVYVNKINMSTIRRTSYWEKIAYVDQNPHIINNTLLYNISLTESDIDNDLVETAVKYSTLYECMHRFEQGLETVITSDSISSGERQKICLARAIYKNASVIILDEATSAMDPASQKNIYDNLCELSKGKICIFVNHDNKLTIENDKIKLLDMGEINYD